MNTLLLAQDFDIGDLVWLVLILGGAIGSILTKKKQQKKEQQPTQRVPRQRGAASARPRAPTPPRAPWPARPPRPERPATSAPAEMRPDRPRPSGLPARPVEARPSIAVRRPTPSRPTPKLPVEVEGRLVHVEAATPDITSLKGLAGEPAAEVSQPPPQRTIRVRPVLRSRPGLRTAFILSEILAPPVGLRDNHPF